MRYFLTSLLILLTFPLNAQATIPEQVKRDFAPLTGIIIMPVGDEYLIDLDSSVNLQEGDLLSLVTPGEKVVHPVTKEVLGSLDDVHGFLQVTRVKSGYSYVAPLSPELKPQKGDTVKRYEHIPAVFINETDNDTLEQQLKKSLSNLAWEESQNARNPQLTFHLTDTALTVTDREGAELHSYPLNNKQLLTTQGTAEPIADPFRTTTLGTPDEDKNFLNRSVDNLLSKIGLDNNKDRRLENPAIIQTAQQQTSGIWVGPNLNGNPVGLAVDDFDGDGKQEVAVAMEDHLQISRLENDQPVPVTRLDFPGGLHLLSLASIDMDDNGVAELYISANVKTRLSSQVVEYRQGRYQRTITRIPWFLNVIRSVDGDEILIGQELGGYQKPFSRPVFTIGLSGKELIQTEDLRLPEQLNIFNFSSLVGQTHPRHYAYISAGDYLYVQTRDQEILWESTEYFGGSEVGFYNVENNEKELIHPVYIPHSPLRTEKGEILVPQNEGPRTFQGFRDFSNSRVVAFTWDGMSLQEIWRTSGQAGYLADFTVADADNDNQDELVMVVKYSQKNFFQKGRSNIVIYELQ